MNELLVSPDRILKSLSDGVYVCDTDRRITYWSASAERMTGWTPGDVIGRKCLEDVLCHIDKDGHRLCGEEHCPLHRSMITGSVTQVPVIVFAQAKDARRIPMQVTAAPILDSSGKVVGGVETFRDVSPMLIDFQRAPKIQQRMLGQSPPGDHRLRFTAHLVPQDIVGGDYYAFRSLDESRHGFMLADMEGHGVAAALYTMQLNLLWERFLPLLTKPSEFAAALNNELVKVFGGDVSFATAVCSVIDASTGTLRLTAAGGPPPLTARRSGQIQKTEMSGLPLGVMEGVIYGVHGMRLEEGESMLLFSDGAFEIDNAAGEILGVDGLIGLLQEMNYPYGNGKVLMVKGQFVSIDQGNRTERVAVGLGAGRSDVQANVQVFELTPQGLQQVDSMRADAKSGYKPGMAEMMGAGAIAGHLLMSTVVSGVVAGASEMTSTTVEADGKRLADKIAIELGNFFVNQAWIPPDAVKKSFF